MALYEEIIAEVKRVIEELVKVEAEQLALEEANNALGSQKCIRVSYTGTAEIKTDGTAMEFDWDNVSGENIGHAEDLETQEFLDIWKGSDSSLRAFEISSDKPLTDTIRDRCHSKKLEPKSIKKDLSLTFTKDKFLLKDFSYTHDGNEIVDHLRVKAQNSILNFSIDIIVNIETASCDLLSFSDTTQRDMSDALAAVLTQDDLSFAGEAVSDLLFNVNGVLKSSRESILRIYDLTEKLATTQSADLFFEASSLVAKRLQSQLSEKNFVDIDILPPAVTFGEGRRRIKVSPSVGGSDNPDASVNIGVQIDTNPDNEPRLPIGRLTCGVDVDAEGKVRGGSFEWRCRF